MDISKDDIELLYTNYKMIEFQIIKLRFELDNIQITGINPINYDLAKSGPTNKISQPTETEALSIVEIKLKYQKRIGNLTNKLCMLDKALELLPPFHKILITKKIIERKQYYLVCAELHISESYAKKIKKMALDKLYNLFNDDQYIDGI